MNAAPVTVAANALSFAGLQWGRRGSGIPVLCLHGFPQRSTSWTRVGERLADAGLHTIAVDQRGYSPGARPLDVSAYAMPHLVADAVGIIDALGGRVHLVGHDWGGVVGWQVAARRPDLVATWTAVSTPNQAALNEVLAADPAERERFGYILGLRDPAAEQRLSAHDWAGLTAFYQGRVAPHRVAEDVGFFAQPGVLTAALNWYRAMSPADAAGLGPVTVPTTYLWGSDDLAFSPAAAAATERWVSGPYRFVPLEGASHWLLDEAPDTLVDAIAEQVLDG
jgi:pimeloyl-ACP methyl ester carboxylesterase